MTDPVLVSPVNISEGRRQEVIDRVAGEAESRSVHLLDLHSDPDHNRSVLTVAGPPKALLVALLNVTGMAVEYLDISRHEGVHPRLGSVDVVPFVPLRPQDRPAALDAAHRYAAEVFHLLGIPSFFYDQAGGGRSLPELRRRAFNGLLPDVPGDPTAAHPTAGAIAVGVRDPLVAYNVDLSGDDLAAARAIATAVRRIDGVRALGLALPSRRQTQVSMNLIRPLVTGIGDAFDAVASLAAEAGIAVAGSELVG
ncbi:MAG TPA: glutamate formiminotransferase, partial [Actinomycetota bacterium]|nr:glutamate formiminotransferase [Actinomycetota bacterium]